MTHNHDFINLSIIAIREATQDEVDLHSISDWLNIVKAFNIFSEGLLTHIQNEDSILYQQVENYIGTNAQFYKLLSDHIHIRNLLQQCHDAIDLVDKIKFSKIFRLLEKAIDEHTFREEELMSVDSLDLESSTAKVIFLLRKLHLN